MSSSNDPRDDVTGPSGDQRRRRSELGEDEDSPSRQRRKPPQPPPKPLVTLALVEAPSISTSPPTQQQQKQQQEQYKQQKQKQQNQHKQQSRSSLWPIKGDVVSEMDADKSKKLLEWELSTLEANDLRSHAWYHGNRVDRIEAEKLLRKCVAIEHAIIDTTITATTDNVEVPPEGEEKMEGEGTNNDSDGLEDMNSDGDFALDDFLDGLVDERGRMPDPSMATSTFMAAALLVNQRRHMDGMLSAKKPSFHGHSNRRNFYCFLVRDSINVRPPGRYVVSCLRVDKYDDVENDNRNLGSGDDIVDEQRRKKFLRRQLRRRVQRQQRHPVLHFVINEIILQPGTVYERSQFTFGDTLPTVAPMSTVNYAMMVNNNVELNEQCTYQPGFDSVPDLIRYYVGGANDNAVLSYKGCNDKIGSSSTMFNYTTHTEVRIRYPCNRNLPLMTAYNSDKVIIPYGAENTGLLRQNSNLLAAASIHTEPHVQPVSEIEQMNVPLSSLHAPHWRHSPPLSPHVQRRRYSPSRLPIESHKTHVTSSFRSSTRRIPTATVTSATVSSETSFKPSSSVESATRGFEHSSTLPRPSISPLDLSTSLPGPTRSFHGSSTSSYIPSTSSLDTWNKTLPKLSSLCPPASGISSSISHSSTLSCLKPLLNKASNMEPYESSMPFSSNSYVALHEPEFNAYEMSNTSLTERVYETGISRTGNSGVIDIDAEIAAALYTSGDDADITDLNITGEFDIPKQIVVCSSFAQANVLNPNQSSSERRQSRPRSRQCRSGSPQSRCDSNRNLTEKHQCPCCKCNTKNSSVIGSDINVNKEKPQEQQDLGPSLSLNVPLITSTLPYEKTVVNEQKSIVLESRKQDMSVRQSSEPAVQPHEQYCINDQKVFQFENIKSSESLVKENKTIFQKNQSDLESQNVDANSQKGAKREQTHDQCIDGKPKWLKNKGHENLIQDSSVVDLTTESIDSDTDVSDVLHDQLVNTTAMQVRLVGSLEQQRQIRRMRLADSRSKINLQLQRMDFKAPPETNLNLKYSPTSVIAQQNLTSDVILKNSNETVHSIIDTHIINHQLPANHSQAEKFQSPSENELLSGGEFQVLSEEELPLAKECQAPSKEGLPLAGECQSPSEKELSLVGECQSLSEEQLSPAGECQSPSEEQFFPAGECHSLMVEHQSPIVDHQSPTVEQQSPTMERQSPTVDSFRLPSVDRQQMIKKHTFLEENLQIQAEKLDSLVMELQSQKVNFHLSMNNNLLTRMNGKIDEKKNMLPNVIKIEETQFNPLGMKNKIQIGLRSDTPIEMRSKTLIEMKKHNPIVTRSEIPMIMTTHSPLREGHCTLELQQNPTFHNLNSTCIFTQTSGKIQLQAVMNETFDGIAERHARTYVPGIEKCSAGPKKVGRMVPRVKSANQMLAPEWFIGNPESHYKRQASNNWCNEVYYKDNTHNNHLTKNHQNTNNHNIRHRNTTISTVDYENLMTGNNKSPKNINYEHIYVNSAKKYCQDNHQRLINSDNGCGTSIAYALRSIHLTIVGNPEDNGDAISVTGTGKLAAALCRADGLVTVLPYRQHRMENVEVIPGEQIPDMCPLQLLGQVGPAGRRARLDVIERFACLQYLVAMTVIVTPCLLLVGDDMNDSAEAINTNQNWSLEDEYEYRRRRFYYRCAGAGGMNLSGEDSSSDDDDDNYELLVDNDCSSGNLPLLKEEWVVEKRHWLETLTRHRAAALDKWIRTAADVKQAVGDVYGYRALMSALCSDRMQSLQEVWASLRQLHTTTAVTFESRLRPEFLGRRDKNIMGEAVHDISNEDDYNDTDVILQLPPNATIPDATVVAMLYEQMYYDDAHNNDGNVTVTTFANDGTSKDGKNPKSWSLITSPLLLLPSPWSSSHSGIRRTARTSVADDLGLQDIHVICIQYTRWVRQGIDNSNSITSSTKPPVLQLDRFRSNFRALLQQYGFGGDDVDDDCEDGYIKDDFKWKNKISSQKKSNHGMEETFAYERFYEDQMEQYGAFGVGDYDDCDDEDEDDDATVICCSNRSSISTVASTDQGHTKVEEVQKRVKDKDRQSREDRYCRWIKAVSVSGPSAAPLDMVFRTELHVRLFWPSTLLLLDSNDVDVIDHQKVIPAYALGTTYAALAAINCNTESKKHILHTQCSSTLNHVITTQLDRASQDMRLRYKAMEEFLDGACAYSTSAAKSANVDR